MRHIYNTHTAKLSVSAIRQFWKMHGFIYSIDVKITQYGMQIATSKRLDNCRV